MNIDKKKHRIFWGGWIKKMFIILIWAMISQLHKYIETDQINHFTYFQFILLQLEFKV